MLRPAGRSVELVGVFDLRERVRTQEVVMWEPLLLPRKTCWNTSGVSEVKTSHHQKWCWSRFQDLKYKKMVYSYFYQVNPSIFLHNTPHSIADQAYESRKITQSYIKHTSSLPNLETNLEHSHPQRCKLRLLRVFLDRPQTWRMSTEVQQRIVRGLIPMI